MMGSVQAMDARDLESIFRFTSMPLPKPRRMHKIAVLSSNDKRRNFERCALLIEAAVDRLLWTMNVRDNFDA